MGTVTFHELKEGLAKINHEATAEEIRSLLEGLDVDGSARIDYNEFLAGSLGRKRFVEDDACRVAFHALDVDGSGKIDKKDLRKALECNEVQTAWDAKTINEVMAEFDKDRDGTVDFDEFLIMMRSHSNADFEEL